MSAITKPHIHSVQVIGGKAVPVNIEDVSSFEKHDATVGGPTNPRTEYQIVFKMKLHINEPKVIVWRFDGESKRNSIYTKVLAAVSTAYVS